MRLLADDPDKLYPRDEVEYFEESFDFDERNYFDEVVNRCFVDPIHVNDQKATSETVKNSFTSMTANNPPIHGNGRDVNNNYGNHFHITINDNTNINNLANKLLNLNAQHPRTKPRPTPIDQKLILYMVGPNESVSVTIAFSGGSEMTWNFNKSCDKAPFIKVINAKDDEEVVILHIFNNGSRSITRVRKNSDHCIEIFNNQDQVVTIEYNGGKTVLSCNYQTVATGRTLSGRSYKVSGEIQKDKLFGDHLKLKTGNCQILESNDFRQNRSKMLKLCPGLQQVFDLLVERQKLYTLMD